MAKAWTPGNNSASLVPPGFNPRPPIPGADRYQARHPTRYRWAKHVKPMIHKLYREMGGPSQIHVNTYLDHPEGFHRTLTSLDVWGGGGRNDPIGHAKGQRAFNLIWNDPGLPLIDWIIWERRIRIRSERFVPKPFGNTEFEFHDDHVHVTFLK
jgi:hypothetical protein